LSERVSMQSISVQRLIPDSEARATIELIALYLQRRRDRINEKMRALQELIPNCNKVRRSISTIFYLGPIWFD
jgi:hypothetical protein